MKALAPWRTALTAAAVIAVANVVVLGVGQQLGAAMVVAQSAGAPATEVGLVQVLLMSIAPTVLGGLALWLAARRSVRAWRAVGWLGFAVGLLTLAMPISVVASTGTTVTLGSMHVLAGLVWVTAVRRAATSTPERSDTRVGAKP